MMYEIVKNFDLGYMQMIKIHLKYTKRQQKLVKIKTWKNIELESLENNKIDKIQF